MARRAVWIGGLVAVIVVAGAVAAGAYALSRAPGWLEAAAENALGRETTIGAVNIDWGWTPTVRLSDVKIDNVEWGEADHFLTARAIAFRLKLSPLLSGRIELPHVTADNPSLAFERNAEGEANWDFGEDSDKSDDTALKIEDLVVREGKLSVRDATRNLDVEGTISNAEAGGDDRNRLQLALDGTLEDKPLSIDISGGSVLSLRTADRPYPADIDLKYGETSLQAQGEFSDPIALNGINLDMEMSGPNLADIHPLFGVPAPSTPPYDLRGRLEQQDQTWKFLGLSGRVGDSSLAGDITIDAAQDPAHLKAALVSESLHVDDLKAIVGASGEGGREDSTGQEDRLIPDVPLEVERLRDMNMDVSLKSDDVHTPDFLPLTRLDTRIVVDAGRLEANPLRLGIAGGTLQGNLALNARSEVPSADVDVTFEKLNLAAFFKGSDYYDTMGGEVQGRLYLLGSGRSLAEVLGSARGNAALAMTGGAISGLLVEAAGVDLTEALALVIGEDAKVPIRCAMARFDTEDGITKIERAVMDTTDSVLYVDGGLNLKAETVNIRMEANAKDFSLLDVDSPVHIDGPIQSPEFSLGEGAPIPFIELGEGEDVPCDKLIEEYLKPPEPK